MADAAAVFETMLAGDGDSEGREPLEAETPQAEDEPEPDAEEAEEEGEPEEQSDEGEESPPSQEQPPTYRVKVAGEEVEVPLPELIKGYAREADYTRKTMAHAEEVKGFQAEREAFAADREKTTNLLRALENTLQAPVYSQEQLDYLRQYDPANFAVAVAENMQRAEQARLAQAERERLERQAQQDRSQSLDQTRKAERDKLFARDPDWRDPTTAKDRLQKARDYALSIGVSDQELNALSTDHRLVVALYDAARMKALDAKKPAVKAKVEQVRTAKPGSTAQKPGKVTEVTRAKQRLAQTGRVDDAAQVFLRMLS